MLFWKEKYLKFSGYYLVIFGIAQLLLACLPFAGGRIAALGDQHREETL